MGIFQLFSLLSETPFYLVISSLPNRTVYPDQLGSNLKDAQGFSCWFSL